MDAVRDFLIATLKYCPVWIPTGVVLWSFGKDWLDRISAGRVRRCSRGAAAC
jgi:hypothetical protein